MRRTLRDVDFRRRCGAVVVGLWRRQGRLDQELVTIRLQAGDVLVLRSEPEALGRVAADPAFLMLVPFQGQPRLPRTGPVAAAITVATVLAAGVGAPLELATLAGAAATVLAGCLAAGQAYRAIDPRLYGLLAGWLGTALAGLSPFAVLLGLYATVALVTEFMSDAATTALLGPVALALAQGLGHPPEPYLITVAVAAVTTFLTPMAHLLIYGPGGCRFGDFARVGTPLTALVTVLVALIAPRLWPA